jgi:hypothetical protein
MSTIPVSVSALVAVDQRREALDGIVLQLTNDVLVDVVAGTT